MLRLYRPGGAGYNKEQQKMDGPAGRPENRKGNTAMDKTLLNKYAEFIVKVGVNVQPGQTLIIRCPIDGAFFGRACMEAALKAGARDVVMRYEDEKADRLRMELASEEALCDVKPYEVRANLDYAESEGGVCLLAIDGEDPEIFKGLDAGKLNRVNMAKRTAMASWREYTMKDRVQWCVVAMPTPAWATSIYPDLPVDEAVETLWKTIFDVCRVTGGDPVSAWKKHVEKTTACRDRLNALDLKSIRMQSANGTDLTVGLADGHTWEGATSVAENGATFIANVPTEEVFTAPHKDHVDGVVKGTKPYVYNGQLIEGFSVTFKDGKVVAHSAGKNDDLLGELLQSDEGACHIGEVALVPASSPINRSGLLFFNTLFDENAACHIAFGASYPGTIKGGTAMNQEELLAHGANQSAIHEDVMVGSADMTITGLTKTGETVLIFKDGEWAF